MGNINDQKFLKLRAVHTGEESVWNTLGFIEKALNGDMAFSANPATLGSSAAAVNTAIGGTAAKFQRTVQIEIESAAGEVLDNFDLSLPIAVAKTSTSGVVAIDGSLTHVAIKNGVGSVILDYTGTWAAADTCTLTVTGGTLLGYTMSNVTSVDTLVA